MITFEPCVNYIKKNGYAQVYLRVTHNGSVDYMKTRFVVNKSGLYSNNKIKDTFVLSEVIMLINRNYDTLKSVDYSCMSTKEVIGLLNESTCISFTAFYERYVSKMIANGRINPASNYKSAINSLVKFTGKDTLLFSDITSVVVNKWIDSLSWSKRAKNMYPTCISTVFSAGQLEYNDYDNDIIKIKQQPFKRVVIPRNSVSKNRDVEKHIILKVLNADTTESDMKTERARDVAILIFFLAGINVVDLYNLKKSDFVNGKLMYNRTKTKNKRTDNAYMEITVPDVILYLFDKYKASGSALFSFSEQINTAKNFLKLVNMGFFDLSRLAGVEKVSSYTFRHSWATFAENECGYSTEQVAFCLNHASAHKVTRGYIRKDFSIVDKINESVINFIMS